MVRQLEDPICFDIASYLTYLDTFSLKKVLWFHVANEIANGKHPVFGAKLKKMGKKAGIADYVFMYSDGCFMVEVKAKSPQTKAQKEIEKECLDKNIPYFIVHSLDELIQVLKDMHIVKDK